jgi:hypothetical protein
MRKEDIAASWIMYIYEEDICDCGLSFPQPGIVISEYGNISA